MALATPARSPAATAATDAAAPIRSLRSWHAREQKNVFGRAALPDEKAFQHVRPHLSVGQAYKTETKRRATGEPVRDERTGIPQTRCESIGLGLFTEAFIPSGAGVEGWESKGGLVGIFTGLPMLEQRYSLALNAALDDRFDADSTRAKGMRDYSLRAEVPVNTHPATHPLLQQQSHPMRDPDPALPIEYREMYTERHRLMRVPRLAMERDETDRKRRRTLVSPSYSPGQSDPCDVLALMNHAPSTSQECNCAVATALVDVDAMDGETEGMLSAEPRRCPISYVYTTRDVEPGEELRWDYGYDPEKRPCGVHREKVQAHVPLASEFSTARASSVRVSHLKELEQAGRSLLYALSLGFGPFYSPGKTDPLFYDRLVSINAWPEFKSTMGPTLTYAPHWQHDKHFSLGLLPSGLTPRTKRGFVTPDEEGLFDATEGLDQKRVIAEDATLHTLCDEMVADLPWEADGDSPLPSPTGSPRRPLPIELLFPPSFSASTAPHPLANGPDHPCPLAYPRLSPPDSPASSTSESEIGWNPFTDRGFAERE